MAKKVTKNEKRSNQVSRTNRKKTVVEEEYRSETGTIGVAPPPQPKIEVVYPTLKNPSLWSRMGGFFRSGTRIGLGAIVGAGVAHGLATIVAGSAWPLATAQAFSFVAATITAGGVGLAVLGIGAATAGVAAIVRAVNPKYKELLNQKALVRKLAKELKRGKNHTLTPEQQQTLAKALDNPKLKKFINRLGKKYNKNNKDELRERLEFAAKNGRTNVTQQERTGFIGFFRNIFRRRTRIEEEEHEETIENEEEITTQEETPEQTYKRIMSKSIFGANLSAREWLALQQIYNAEMKALRADIRKLSAIENPTPAQQKELAEKVAMEKKITNLEERAFRAAKKAAQAEAADNNNSLSAEERAIFQDFATKGRRSTEAKKVVTEDDRKRAVQGVATYTRLTEEEPKKSKPKSGGR